MGSIPPSKCALLALTAAVGWGSCGCSFIFVKGPPSQPRQARVIDCTTSKVAPVLDSVFGGLQVVRTVLATTVSDSYYQTAPISRGTDIGLGLAFTALFVGSAAYGIVETGQCADLKEKFESDKSNAADDKNEEASTARPRAFDVQAARAAVEKALGVAATSCHPSGGQRAQIVATMTYGTDGRVSNLLLEPSPQDSTVGGCLVNALRDANVPPFDGEPAVVKKRFDWGS